MSRPLPCDEASRVRAFVINGLTMAPCLCGTSLSRQPRGSRVSLALKVELAWEASLGVSFHLLEGEYILDAPREDHPHLVEQALVRR